MSFKSSSQGIEAVVFGGVKRDLGTFFPLPFPRGALECVQGVYPMDQKEVIRDKLDSGTANQWKFFFTKIHPQAKKETKLEFWRQIIPEELQIQKLVLREDNPMLPMEPFLSPLRQRFDFLTHQEKSRVLDALETYPLHRPWIIPWLQGHEYDRWDDVFRIGDELTFERPFIFKMIYGLLNLLWVGSPQVFILEAMEKANPSLILFLLWGIKNKPPGAHRILGIFNLGSKTKEYLSEALRQEFFSEIEKSHVLLLQPLKGVLYTPSHPRNGAVDSELLGNGLKLIRHFQCFEDFKGYSKHQLRAKSGATVEMSLEKGLILALTERYNEALVPLQFAQEGAKIFAPHLKKRILLIMALCYFKKMDRSFAEKYLKLAVGDGHFEWDTEEGAFSAQVYMMIKQDLFEIPKERETYFQWLEAFEEAGKETWALITKTSLTFFRAVATQQGWQAAVTMAQSILVRVKFLKNDYQEAKIYHQLAYLHKETEPEKAQEYFSKTISCRRQMGVSLGLVKDYNGAGYFNLSQGHFDLALEYFQEALELLTKTKDFTETCLTLFNVSLVYFFSGSYHRALEIYQIILQVLDLLSMDSLPWHSRKKLETLAGISAFFLEQKTFSLDYWERVSDQSENQTPGAAYYLLKGLIGDLMEVNHHTESSFNLAYDLSKGENLINFSSFCLFQKALFLKDKGLLDLGNSTYVQAEELLGKDSQSIQRKLYSTWWETGLIEPHGFAFDPTIEAISQRIVQSAVQEASSFALRRKLHEMSFLKHFQDQMSKDRLEKALFKAARDVILQYYPLESLSFFELKDKSAQMIIGYPPKKTFPEVFDIMNLPTIMPYTKPRLNSTPHSFSLLVPLHNRAHRELWMGLLSTTVLGGLTQDDAQTVLLALRNLELSLDLNQTEEDLRKSLATDHLTGALSRNEFLKRAEKEIQRCLRYAKNSDRFLSVIFLDLDNFKYYNDTFGHGTGDGILKLFSNLVKSGLRDLDSFGRFGGDEFVILLPETDEAGAKVVGNRILQKLQDPKGFRRSLMVDLDISETVPKEKLLGCSMGIAFFSPDQGLSLADLLERADQGLYKAKRAGKNCIGQVN